MRQREDRDKTVVEYAQSVVPVQLKFSIWKIRQTDMKSCDDLKPGKEFGFYSENKSLLERIYEGGNNTGRQE